MSSTGLGTAEFGPGVEADMVSRGGGAEPFAAGWSGADPGGEDLGPEGKWSGLPTHGL